MKKTPLKKDQNDKEAIKKLADDLGDLMKSAKSKYKNADDRTKKGIVSAMAAATAVIGGAIGYKKYKDKKKK